MVYNATAQDRANNYSSFKHTGRLALFYMQLGADRGSFDCAWKVDHIFY